MSDTAWDRQTDSTDVGTGSPDGARREAPVSLDHVRSLFDNLEEAFFAVDDKGRYTYFSRASERVVGYDAEAIVGRHFSELVYHEDMERAEMVYRSIMAGAEVAQIELRIVTKSGEIRSIICKNKPINEGGRIVGVRGIIFDVTERKEAQKALRESEEHYRELVESINEVVYAFDAEGRFVYASPVVERLLGYSPEELMGLKLDDFVHEKDRDKLASNRRLLLAGDSIGRNEYRLVTRSGELCWVLTSSKPVVEDGRVTGVRGVLFDITRDKKVEEELRQSEVRYSRLVEDLPLLICGIDPNGRIDFVNGAFRCLFGPGRADLIGMDYEGLLDENEKKRVRDILDALTPESPLAVADRKAQTPDGGVRWQRWIIRALFDGDGRLLGYKVAGQDITEQRALEEQLRQSEKMRAIGLLAGGVAHDFNNQLTAIIGCADLLRTALEDNGDLAGYAELILQAARHSSGIAAQLLAFARKGTLRSATVDLHGIVAEVVAMIAAGLDKRVEVMTNLSANPSFTVGDVNQLESALLNIALNARNAIEGAGCLVFETENVILDGLRCRCLHGEPRPGEYIAVSITDTGAGMDEETLKHIFEPFFTTQSHGRGSGMGLSVVYGTIRGHSGAIEVLSEPGGGTTFRLFLPAALTSEPDCGAPHAPVRPGRAARIVLVDDETVVRRVAAEMLRALGHKVTTFSGGSEALGYYRDHWNEVDLVILDVTMPAPNGHETLDKMREIDPSVKALLVSGRSGDSRIITHAQRDGVHFVSKPFDMARLSECIQSVLAGA